MWVRAANGWSTRPTPLSAPPNVAAASVRTNVYVDGFNLYYALKQAHARRCRWLDLEALCGNVLQKQHAIHRIRYFTARVKPRPSNPDQHRRQEAYLRALMTNPKLEAHFGSFLSHERLMPKGPMPGGPEMVSVVRTEEKGSDVNLASYLMLDAFRNDFECAVVITNDSDLTTPIRLVRDELHLRVGVLNPHEKPSAELKDAASFYLKITSAHLAKSCFPDRVVSADGRSFAVKPAKW